MTAFLRLAAGLVGVALAAGCSGLPNPLAEPEAQPPSKLAVVTAPPPGPETRPDDPEPAPPEARVLLGETPARVQTLLGPPRLVRREGAVQVMQYGAKGCVFDVVFYEAGPGAPFKAGYVESRDLTGAMLAPGACFDPLVSAEDYADWADAPGSAPAVDAPKLSEP